METTNTMTKGRNGWGVESDYFICKITNDAGKEADRVLRLTTSKGSKGIQSHFSVIHKSGGYYTHVFGLGGAGDWSKRLPVVNTRATEKAIREAHIKAAEQFPAMLEEALQWYAQGRDKA